MVGQARRSKLGLRLAFAEWVYAECEYRDGVSGGGFER